MKKIAVITSGLLPMPAIRGGAIETLLQYAIDYNEKNQDFLYDIYCIYDNEAQLISKKYQNSTFNYISFNKVISNIYYNFCRVVRKLGCNDPNFQKLYIHNVCKKLKNKEYDLILIESDNHFVLPIKSVTKVPIVLYLHNDKLNGSTKNAKEIFDACYKIITVSDYIKNRVCEISKSESGKVTTILNGIDTNKFNLKNRTEIRENFRKQYGISNDDFVFLFTGRFEPNKGVLELVKAFNQIQNQNCKLLFF